MVIIFNYRLRNVLRESSKRKKTTRACEQKRDTSAQSAWTHLLEGVFFVIFLNKLFEDLRIFSREGEGYLSIWDLTPGRVGNLLRAIPHVIQSLYILLHHLLRLIETNGVRLLICEQEFAQVLKILHSSHLKKNKPRSKFVSFYIAARHYFF